MHERCKSPPRDGGDFADDQANDEQHGDGDARDVNQVRVVHVPATFANRSSYRGPEYCHHEGRGVDAGGRNGPCLARGRFAHHARLLRQRAADQPNRGAAHGSHAYADRAAADA